MCHAWSVGSANLELVRSILAPLALGHYSSATGWADPEIECVLADGPEPGRASGLAAIAARWREFFSAFEGVRFEATEYRELTTQRVLVLGRYDGRGRASALELGQVGSDTAAVFHIRGGKVTELVLYYDRDRALADLGLAPQGKAADRPD